QSPFKTWEMGDCSLNATILRRKAPVFQLVQEAPPRVRGVGAPQDPDDRKIAQGIGGPQHGPLAQGPCGDTPGAGAMRPGPWPGPERPLARPRGSHARARPA